MDFLLVEGLVVTLLLVLLSRVEFYPEFPCILVSLVFFFSPSIFLNLSFSFSSISICYLNRLSVIYRE